MERGLVAIHISEEARRTATCSRSRARAQRVILQTVMHFDWITSCLNTGFSLETCRRANKSETAQSSATTQERRATFQTTATITELTAATSRRQHELFVATKQTIRTTVVDLWYISSREERDYFLPSRENTHLAFLGRCEVASLCLSCILWLLSSSFSKNQQQQQVTQVQQAQTTTTTNNNTL